MLTPERLAAMTDEERLALFDQMQAEVYGGTGSRANEALAADMNVHPLTPYRWRKTPASLPWAVLYALDAMASQAEAERIATVLAKAAKQCNAAARRLTKA